MAPTTELKLTQTEATFDKVSTHSTFNLSSAEQICRNCFKSQGKTRTLIKQLTAWI